MRDEALKLIDDIAFTREADFRDFLDAPYTFANGPLAQLYGLIPDAGVLGDVWQKFDLPVEGKRGGLLGQGGFLAAYAHISSSSPTLCGKFVREVLMCQGIPAPPPDVDTTLPDSTDGPTARERFTLHRADPTCAGCHQLMDPIGLGLENFDAIGRYRAQEGGVNIDASGELDGTAFSGPAQLADALAQHPQLGECLSRIVFRYAWGRLESAADEAFVQELAGAFAGDSYRLQGLLRSAVTSPSFVNVGELD
jgi:hypothetical protein